MYIHRMNADAESYPAIDADILAVLISRKYDFEKVQCRLLVRGVGDTYLVETVADRFILRIYRPSHRSLPQIKEEVELLSALKKAGVSVSFPVADLSEDSILEIETNHGTRHAVLFTFAPGNPVKVLNEQQLLSFGRQMALFHNVSSVIRLGKERWEFDFETTIDIPLQNLKNAFADLPEEYAWLLSTSSRLKEKLKGLSESAFSYGYCHFDFLPKNLHFENDSVTFFDFDFMGYGLLVNDIMTFWQHLLLEVYTGRMTRHTARESYATFLNGYRKHRFISDDELALTPYLTLGFWLFYMNFHTTHDQFHQYSQPAHLKPYVGFLKYVVSNFWNERRDLFDWEEVIIE